MYIPFRVDMTGYLPLREIVFNNIRDAIITGRFLPGQRLMENQLAEKIGVSRTPIREALRKLELEGYVEMIPRKGAVVAVLSEKDIRDVLEIRATLEVLAAKLACKYITDEQITKLEETKLSFEKAAEAYDVELMTITDTAYHEIIFCSTQNMKLVQIINNLSEQINRFRVAYLNDKSSIKNIVKEHNDIFNAIKNRNEKTAEKYALKHIEDQKNVVVSSLI